VTLQIDLHNTPRPALFFNVLNELAALSPGIVRIAKRLRRGRWQGSRCLHG